MSRTVAYWDGESWKQLLLKEGKEIEWVIPDDWKPSLFPYHPSLLTSLLNTASNDFWFPSSTADDVFGYWAQVNWGKDE